MGKRKDLEIMGVLVASTAHLTPEEGAAFNLADATGSWADALKGDNIGRPLSWEYGWIFYIGCPGDWDPEGQQLGPGFLALVKLAREQGIQWLRFDADGPEVAGIPTYSW